MKRRKQKFPIRVEKNGVTVPVYRMRSGNGYISFVISYRENGARKKNGFATVGEAVKAAKRAAGHIASGNAEAVKLRPEDAQAYLRAAAVLKPFRIRVDTVASEYVAAVKVLGKNATLAASKILKCPVPLELMQPLFPYHRQSLSDRQKVFDAAGNGGFALIQEPLFGWSDAVALPFTITF